MSDYEATSQGLPAPGESLGDYLADGEACADNRELDCSSGESSCSALNQVCCKAVYDLSNVRGEVRTFRFYTYTYTYTHIRIYTHIHTYTKNYTCA